MTFDSLTFARRLKAAGCSEDQAEALADANRDMLVPDLATEDDLKAGTGRLRLEITGMERRLLAVVEKQTLRLTVRTGVMLAAGLSLMTAVMGVLLRFH
jgi:hypothetical protein